MANMPMATPMKMPMTSARPANTRYPVYPLLLAGAGAGAGGRGAGAMAGTAIRDPDALYV